MIPTITDPVPILREDDRYVLISRKDRDAENWRTQEAVIWSNDGRDDPWSDVMPLQQIMKWCDWERYRGRLPRPRVIVKSNPNHDNLGRFSTRQGTAGGGTSPSGNVATVGGAAVAGESAEDRAARLAYNREATKRWREKKQAEAAAKKAAEGGGAGGGATPKEAEAEARKKAEAEWEEKGHYKGDLNTATAEDVMAGSPKRIRELADRTGMLATDSATETYIRGKAEAIEAHREIVDGHKAALDKIDEADRAIERAMNGDVYAISKGIGSRLLAAAPFNRPLVRSDLMRAGEFTNRLLSADPSKARVVLTESSGKEVDTVSVPAHLHRQVQDAMRVFQQESEKIGVLKAAQHLSDKIPREMKGYQARIRIGDEGGAYKPSIHTVSTALPGLTAQDVSRLALSSGLRTESVIGTAKGSDLVKVGQSLSTAVANRAAITRAALEAQPGLLAHADKARKAMGESRSLDDVLGLNLPPTVITAKTTDQLRFFLHDANNWAKANAIAVPSGVARATLRSLPSAEVARVKAHITDTWDTVAHAGMKAEIHNVFGIVPSSAMKAGYAAANADHDNAKADLFHGTGAGAAAGISSTGYRVSSSDIKAGRMLGDGVYLADRSSKSIQYIGATFGRKSARGVLLLNSAAMGKVFSPKSHDEYSRGYFGAHKDDHTIYGAKGAKLTDNPKGLLNNEWCVKSSAAILPTHWIDCSRVEA